MLLDKYSSLEEIPLNLFGRFTIVQAYLDSALASVDSLESIMFELGHVHVTDSGKLLQSDCIHVAGDTLQVKVKDLSLVGSPGGLS
jgi:hypothetical protein